MNIICMFEKCKINNVKKRLFDKSIISVAAWMFVMTTVYSVVAGILLLCPAQDVILNILFQFFLMTVPGLTVTVTLFKEKHDPLFASFLSYAFGYVIIIIEYFVSMPLGRQYCLLTALLVFALSCILLWIKRDVLKTDHLNEKIPLGYLIVFLVLLVSAFFSFSAKVGGAENVQIISMMPDNQFWLGNASALSISFPPVNTRLAGYAFRYHYFSSIPIAFQANATGMSVYSVATVYYALPKSLLLFGGVYAVLSSLKLNTKSIVFAMLAIIFTTGIEVLNYQTLVYHMMLQPFGYDVAIGCSCWMLYFVVEQYHKKVFDCKLCACAIIFMATACGSKSPIAAIFMIAAGIICFGWLFGKEYIKAFSYGLGLLAAFALVIVTIVINPSTTTNTTTGGFSPHQLFYYNSVLRSLYSTSLCKMQPKFLILPTVVCIYLMADPLPTFFGIVGIFHIAKWKKARNAVYLGFAVSVLVGVCMGLLWEHAGKSNLYYAMTARVLAIIFGACLFDKELAKAKPILSRNFASLLSVMLCFQMFLFFFVGFDEGCFKSMCRGIHKLSDVYTNNVCSDFVASHYYEPQCVNYTDIDKVEALNWIRKNTDKESVIATHDSVAVNPNFSMQNYMYSPIFSERICYMEGCIYMRSGKAHEDVLRRTDLLYRMYRNDKEALLQLKEEGVDYIVCDRSEYPLFNPTPKYATMVFRNGRISVYKIK